MNHRIGEDVARLLERRWLLVGIGHELRSDDAFGPLLARRLRAMGLPALDGGPAPENLTGSILRERPEVLLLADIAEFGADPGAVRLARPGELGGGTCSTHDPGLALTLSYLQAQHDFDCWLIAVQPKSLEFAGPLSAGGGTGAGRHGRGDRGDTSVRSRRRRRGRRMGAWSPRCSPSIWRCWVWPSC